ncbi:MAG TPA: winged helix-turn-helix domain-containing protein [Hyphomicrobium sp.]|nr:winged helix-turn-helix domain-containing protein [Hyphomicrobium sp.]
MTRVILRIDFDDDRYLGHGRIELLERIEEYGSIAKAAKSMGMSYKRAWYLAESINSTFCTPVVTRQHGGKGGGSAELTALGKTVVREYRGMEAAALKTFSKSLRKLEKTLRERKPVKA